MGQTCLSLLCLVPLRIVVLLMVPALISTEWVTAQLTHSSKSSEKNCYYSREDSQISTTKSRPFVKPWVWSPPELPVLNRPSMRSLPRWLCLQPWKRTSAPLQKTSALSLHAYARLKQMQLATFVSTGSGSASSWNLLGQNDGSTASGSLGSHGPGSSDDNRNTRRRLDTFSSPEDEHARSAVLSRFPCEQYHTGEFTWLEKFWATTNASAFNKPTRIHCKTACPPDSSSKQELSVRTLWLDTKIMVSPTKLTVHFAMSVPKSRSASPSHLRIENLEDDLRLFGKFCPQCCKKSSQNEMLKILSLSPHLTAFWIAGTVWEHRFSNFRHLDTNICLILLLLTCANLAFLMMCYDKLFVKPAARLRIVRPLLDGRPFASSPFRSLASRGPSFRGFLVWWPIQFAIYLARCLTLVTGKFLKPSAIVRTTLCLATSVPPYGLANVNPC